jgi:hypothetical protein
MSDGVTVKGSDLDPNGKPVRWAKLLFLYRSGKRDPQKVWARSNEEGRFAFTVPFGLLDNRFSESPWRDTHVMAVAEGYGFAVMRLGKHGADNLTLRLVRDDVPLRGRILDLQGKPIAGVRVRIDGSLYTPEKDDLTDWLSALKAKNRDPNLVWWDRLTNLDSAAFDVFFPPITTGGDGRFCLKGIGRERVAELRIEGPTIATQAIHVMTRSIETVRIPEVKGQPKSGTVSYFGASFDLVAAPTRPIVGVVRDTDTGKPLPGITIETEEIANRFALGFIRTTTDKDGRYSLIGLPKSDGNKIAVTTDELPYLGAVKTIGNPLGLQPLTVDFALKHAVWVKGRVTEKTTGKPLFARVEYFCFDENPNADEVTQLFYHNSRSTEQDGSYRIPVFPGRGLIAVRAFQDHYVMRVGGDKIKDSNSKRTSGMFSTVPYRCFAGNFHSLTEISPQSGDEAITCDVTLLRGRSLKGTVLDPDGKPLDGVSAAGLKDMGYWLNTGAKFTVESLQPNKPRLLQFVHEGKKLAGYVSLRGDEITPLTVRLQPWGTLTGRLLTLEGDSLAGANVTCGARSSQTGKDGHFRIEGLAAGLKYNLFITKEFYVRHIDGKEPKDLTFKAGETKVLGDLKIKPER